LSARTSAATVEKSIVGEELDSLTEQQTPKRIQVEQQTPKRIQVEQQTPKRIQIEDDAERSRSFVARITSNSIDELGELASDLTSALQNLQEFLKSEGERVQREIVDYAHLNRTAVAAIKTIIETAGAPSNGKASSETA
jgi:excinuclease UvrABC nuclease subunit